MDLNTIVGADPDDSKKFEANLYHERISNIKFIWPAFIPDLQIRYSNVNYEVAVAEFLAYTSIRRSELYEEAYNDIYIVMTMNMLLEAHLFKAGCPRLLLLMAY